MNQFASIALLLLTAFAGCHSSTPTPAPTSVEEFSSAFRTAYDNGDEGSLSELFDWSNVDSKVQKLQLGMVTVLLGKHKITDISIIPFDPATPSNPVNGREVELNITPTHMFSAKHQGNAGFQGGASSGSVMMPIGKRDGRYYFCGWAYKEVN